MSMKKADLEKHMAKKIDGRMKSGAVPLRFGQGSAAKAAAKPASSAIKLVPLACRLPAELTARLRERAVSVEGGMNAILTQALERWLVAEAPAG